MDYLRKEIENYPAGLAVNNASFLGGMRENLLKGIEYYQGISSQLAEDSQRKFLGGLEVMAKALEPLFLEKSEV